MAHFWVLSKVARDYTVFMKPLEFESTKNEPHAAMSDFINTNTTKSHRTVSQYWSTIRKC